jgi:signal transduction histidine kinase
VGRIVCLRRVGYSLRLTLSGRAFRVEPVKSVLPLKIAVPLVLGIVASLAIAIYAEFGFRRLEVANREMGAALEVDATLHEMLALVVDAETGQRGYLLTGKDEYLQPYIAALPKIDDALHRARELLVVHGTVSQRDTLGRVSSLVGRKISELEMTIALYQKGDSAMVESLMDTGIGNRTMGEIRRAVQAMTDIDRRQVDDATKRWAADIAFARLGMQVMTTFTVALLVIVWLLSRRDTAQREERRRSALEDKRRLEELVEERTADLSELSDHLQIVREEEKAKLARDLHDELGGILVSAKMDVDWVEQHLNGRDPVAATKLERAQQALDDGVQIKRRIIEELRPTLLDNLGLSSALDWQMKEICNAARLTCTIDTPDDDQSIPPQISIALYRILQEALTNIVKYARAKSVHVDLGLTPETVTLLIEDDGIGIADKAPDDRLSHGIVGMRQRAKALHGEFSIGRRPEGGTRIEVHIPLPDRQGQHEVLPGAAAPEP